MEDFFLKSCVLSFTLFFQKEMWMNLLHIDIYRLSLRDAKTALMMKNFLGFSCLLSY